MPLFRNGIELPCSGAKQEFFLTFTDINTAFCLITGSFVIGKHFGQMYVERNRRILFLMR